MWKDLVVSRSADEESKELKKSRQHGKNLTINKTGRELKSTIQ